MRYLGALPNMCDGMMPSGRFVRVTSLVMFSPFLSMLRVTFSPVFLLPAMRCIQ